MRQAIAAAMIVALTTVLGTATGSDRRQLRDLSAEDRAKLLELQREAQGAYEGHKPTDLSQVPTGRAFADQCMAAWTYLGKDAIADPRGTRLLGEEFTEANAAWHWQHYLPGAISQYTPEQVKAFYAATFKAEQAIAAVLQKPDGRAEFFKILGECHRPPEARSIKDSGLILRNYLVGRKILPPQAALPPERLKQLSQSVWGSAAIGDAAKAGSVFAPSCHNPERRAKLDAIKQCADKGGYPLGDPRMPLDQLAQIQLKSPDYHARLRTCQFSAELLCAVY